jgi:hypothetical protein
MKMGVEPSLNLLFGQTVVSVHIVALKKNYSVLGKTAKAGLFEFGTRIKMGESHCEWNHTFKQPTE